MKGQNQFMFLRMKDVMGITRVINLEQIESMEYMRAESGILYTIIEVKSQDIKTNNNMKDAAYYIRVEGDLIGALQEEGMIFYPKLWEESVGKVSE